MQDIARMNLDYHQPVKLSDDVYWVGSFNGDDGLRYNPYLIVDNDEAVVIDGGSRSDFPSVMLKILQTGIVPSKIKALIYHHYDPDRCGSINNFEDIIDSEDLQIISEPENLVLIRHYQSSSHFISTGSIDSRFKFSSGRELVFVKTPYSQGSGSFVTFDTKSKVLFSSELFGSYGGYTDLFLDLNKDCDEELSEKCPLGGILDFHKNIFSSERALKYAVEQAVQLPFEMIAPQRGMVITKPADVLAISEKLVALKGVGIDGVLGERSYQEIGNISKLRERLEDAE